MFLGGISDLLYGIRANPQDTPSGSQEWVDSDISMWCHTATVDSKHILSNFSYVRSPSTKMSNLEGARNQYPEIGKAVAMRRLPKKQASNALNGCARRAYKTTVYRRLRQTPRNYHSVRINAQCRKVSGDHTATSRATTWIHGRAQILSSRQLEYFQNIRSENIFNSAATVSILRRRPLRVVSIAI